MQSEKGGNMNVSYSRCSTYAGCPREHWYAYVMGITPKKPERPLFFGGDFHKLLELRGNKPELKKAIEDIKSTFYDMPADFQSDLGDNYIDDLKIIFTDYQHLYKEDELPAETEHWFETPIGKFQGEPVKFVGKIDEIYTGEILGEHKTFSVAPDLSVLVMNQQINLYAKAREIETGVVPSKVKWDYIKSRPASEPVWLDKSQRFSEAASSSITPMSWLRACKARGITDEAILSKADRYSQNISNFFFRHTLEINKNMVSKMWDDFKDLAREVVVKGGNNKRQNITRDCSWCSYRPLCYAEFTGADTDYIIKKDFTER
jgi:hypothetical protein